MTVGFGWGASREANERVRNDTVGAASLPVADFLIRLTTVPAAEIVRPTQMAAMTAFASVSSPA